MRNRKPWLVLLLVAVAGLLLFVWRLGMTGLVDETPLLFAASAKAMAETGDWLTPRVNGLPRYDKPPLVYWLMGLGYALPAQGLWNPFGTWASRLPSALSSIGLMLLMALTLLRRPQGQPDGAQQAVTAMAAALAFALSPLVLLWSRISVSDALFSGLLSAALLLFWWRYAGLCRWWVPWLVLGLAVLAKGPVAVVLAGLTALLFALLQRDLPGLWALWRPWRGLALTAAVALPWYVLELLVEGQPYWDSFFAYHNLQRFTGVVNNHLQPWWFFFPVLVVASLPFTPLLLAGLVGALRPQPAPPEQSLQRFAACWLLAVFVFFTAAATKLPSYWIPATPAAGLLIALAAQNLRPGWRSAVLRGSTLALVGVLTAGLAAGNLWVPLINEPEMPTLSSALLASGALTRASLCFGVGGVAALLLWWGPSSARRGWLLVQQLGMGAFVVTALVPMVELGDRLRQLPIRRMASLALEQQRPQEPLAMVGILKPSLHYYTQQVVVYEGVQPNGPLNLNDRLAREQRRGQQPSPASPGASVLVVIDGNTATLPHWRGVPHQRLGTIGLYELWRVPRPALNQWSKDLAERAGLAPDWQEPRPERY
ncbi:MAG: glycosyltransferase family 39 protein [Synechococcaceae bacterium WB7_3xG_012]|nr:glycosyltransferase family 39 protein [Synechococcaceae bacterium WB7_3xG_012]